MGCPEGTGELEENETTCPDGKYCEGSNEEPCGQGYYCASGERTACPIGTFGDEFEAISRGECKNCTTGSYCNRLAMASPDECMERYYCEYDETNSVSRQIICPIGFACSSGLRAACSGIEYTSSMGETECKTCPDRYLCQDGIISNCPVGQYCKNGIATGCPPGTWSDNELLMDSNECMYCPAGFYCPVAGIKSLATLTESYVCPEGFWCRYRVEFEPTTASVDGGKSGACQMSTM